MKDKKNDLKLRRRQGLKQKLQDYQGLNNELSQETDRAAAIVGAAFLDLKLKELLRSFLVDDESAVADLIGGEDGGERPLSSFSTRISACYCLGLISKEERDDLNILRSVRNRFAHGLHGLSFKDEEISSLCQTFKFIRRIIPVNYFKESRQQFTLTVSLLATDFELKALSISDQRRTVRPETPIEISFNNTDENL